MTTAQGSMVVDNMPSFLPNSNPFNHDAYHMGQWLGTNCTVMFENHDDKECKYLIVVNTITGERIRINFVSI